MLLEDISDYPTSLEILGYTSPDITPLLIKGAYRSPEIYLDIHDRLLKEDFMSVSEEVSRLSWKI